MKLLHPLFSGSRLTASPVFLELAASTMARADLITSDGFNYANNTALQAVWGVSIPHAGGLSFRTLSTSGSAVQTTGTGTPVRINKTPRHRHRQWRQHMDELSGATRQRPRQSRVR